MLIHVKAPFWWEGENLFTSSKIIDDLNNLEEIGGEVVQIFPRDFSILVRVAPIPLGEVNDFIELSEELVRLSEEGYSTKLIRRHS